MEENPLSFSTSDKDFLFNPKDDSNKQKRRSTGDCSLSKSLDQVFSSDEHNSYDPHRADKKLAEQKEEKEAAKKIVLINGVFYYQS